MPSPNNPPKGPPITPPGKAKKQHKTFEIKVYLLISSYSGDLELLTTIYHRAKDVFTDSGKPINIAAASIEEYVRNIGLFGITVEDPKDFWSYYPPSRIGKIEYTEVDQD